MHAMLVHLPTPRLLAAAETVRHRITSGLVEGFSEWWEMPALVAVLCCLAGFAVWMIRRDAAELPRGVAAGLATLRLGALAAIAAAYLDFERTAEHELVLPSRVAVLVDTSASMTLADGEDAAGTRAQRAGTALDEGGLLAALAAGERALAGLLLQWLVRPTGQAALAGEVGRLLRAAPRPPPRGALRRTKLSGRCW